MRTNNLPSFGADLSGATSFNHMLALMGADWNVEPIGLRTVEGHDVPDRRALVRSDSRRPLAVVSPKYKPIQTRDMLRPLAQIVAETKDSDRPLKLQRGGTWGGGEQVWLRATMNGAAPIGPRAVGDLIRCDVSIIVDHSGAGKSRGVLSPMRLVCLNGMVAPRGGAAFELDHRGDVEGRLQAYREGLAAVAADWRRSVTIFNRMSETRVSTARRSIEEIIRGYTAAVFGRAELAAQTASGGDTRRVRAIEEAYNRGAGSLTETTDGTGWGLYQALTHYLTHGRALTETRHAGLVDGAAARTSERGIDVAYALSVKQIPLEAVLDADSPAMVAVRRELAAFS